MKLTMLFMMKKMHKILFGLILSIMVLSGCDLILKVDSDRLVLPADHQLNSPNDTIYSMIGIFSQLEKLMDRYVLLGELRGDLMDVTEYANPNLREIYNFEISEDNPYNKIEDYYAVINNCNYLISNIDTALVLNSEKVLLKEFAAAKSIRAWTYLQLVLNYGKVKYFEKPVLMVKDSAEYTEYTMQELIPILIYDLEPWKDIDHPGSIFFGISSEYLYFPVRFVLGDLYLWLGEYENAAREYHQLMLDQSYITSPLFQSVWTVDNGVFVSREFEDQRWLNKLTADPLEQITLIAGSKEYGRGAALDSLSWFNYEIAPSAVAFDTWENQTYYHNALVTTEGDLRGDFGSYIRPETLKEIETEFFEETNLTDNSLTLITKYILQGNEIGTRISVYRSTLLYLRYAEAVNRAGKPNLAFAVLKNGMSSSTMEIDSIVPRHEKYSQSTDSTGTFIDYVNFEDEVFNNNIGVHEFGCGNVNQSIDFIIPALGSLQDSTVFVEDKIVEELALETAMEGNRFHDLMRIAWRRGDPSYLANSVSEKYAADKDAIRSRLLDESNWHLE